MGRKLKLGVLVAFFVLMLSACTYAGTYRLTVNKGTNCVTVYEKQGNNYVPIKAMICSVGANDVSLMSENNAIYYNKARDNQKFRPYQAPDEEWLKDISAKLH